MGDVDRNWPVPVKFREQLVMCIVQDTETHALECISATCFDSVLTESAIMKDPNAPPPLSQAATRESNRHRLTLEAMADVEADDIVSHTSVPARAARVSAKRLTALGGSQPDLQVPSRRRQET